MSEQRPDTDERREPAGTPSPGPDDLTATPTTPGDHHPADGRPSAVPGAYEADEGDRERGKAVKPGN